MNGYKKEFTNVLQNVKDSASQLDCTGGGVMVIHKGNVVLEQYWGTQSKEANARLIQEDTQFHIASVRKSYIGFAIAFAVQQGMIAAIDDPLTAYLPEYKEAVYENVTIRHLLTHTHGLQKVNGKVIQEFEAGTGWAYRGIGVELLTQIVKVAAGKDIAAILQEQVFHPLHYHETGWYEEMQDNFAEVIRYLDDPAWNTSDNTDGSQMNMYVSVRELAAWGQLHLNRGKWNGQQVVEEEIFHLATALQTPMTVPNHYPQNGYLWFVQKEQGLQAERMEISPHIPAGAYQLLGYTGVTLLVIPQYEVVAVRAFNSFGLPPGYDYLEDVRSFGSAVMQSISECTRIKTEYVKSSKGQL